jgi:hypothetical protein
MSSCAISEHGLQAAAIPAVTPCSSARPPSVGDYDTWAAGYPALVGLPDDDDDLDGYANSYEWAFALDPTNPASRSWLATPFDAANGTFSYNRRAQGLNGLTYKVWYSTDLVEWFWDAGANEVPGSAVDDVETVMVTIDPELLNEPRLFVSLSAEDMGPPPVISSLWGANTAITINYSEAMGSSATDPANYTVQQDGGGSVSVTEASLSGDGKTVTLTLDSALSIGSSFTVTTSRIANATGQPLGNGTSGQFQTWDDDPNGIKVFILAGQSNMVGYGHTETGQTGDGGIGTLRYFAQPANNPSYPEYDYTSLLDDPGQPTTSAWKTRSNVKLWWKNGASGNLDGPIYKGDLGPLTSNGQWFGPEYGFGQIIGDHYVSDDVLIIKTAWGGHTLAGDFRPPSAVAARGGEVGASYREIFDDARQILDNLGTEFPEWAGRGYQIVGFAWHQGTSDKSPIERALEYKDNLALVVHATSIDGFRGSRVGMPLRGIRRTFNHARGRLGEPSLPPDAESGNPSYHLAQTTSKVSRSAMTPGSSWVRRWVPPRRGMAN